MELKTNSKRNYTVIYRLNNMHLNDQWVIEENREIQNLPESNEM
jgi:hypothetical protein